MRTISGPVKYGISAWLAAMAMLHFYFTIGGYPEPLKLASLHLMLAVPPIFLLYPAGKGSPEDRPSILDWCLAVLAFLPSLYIYLNTDRVYDHSPYIDPLTTTEVVLGTLMVLLVLEAVRRSLSVVLSLLVSLVILYMFICDLLPGIWYYRDLPYTQVIDILYLMNGSGLYGTLTGISATIVATFLIFGAFLQTSGMGNLFMNLGTFVAGRYTGGPAKVVVVESGLFGMTSGSSVANVVVTGAVTIPEMKRMGFSPAMAGGIEAAASVGGLIMPPIMGAAAFVMAEMISVPYVDIVAAAAIGAALYYLGVFCSVHFMAKKLGIKALPKEEIATFRDVLKDIHFAIPLIVLMVLMSQRYSPYFSAFWATIAVFICSWLRKHSRMGWRKVLDAFVDAGATICIIAVAVAAAGMITAGLTNTGLLLAFTGIIKLLAGNSLLLLVLLVAVSCLFLGMGVPTTPAYIITAAIGAPLIAEHGGASLIAIHLFVLYFAVMADATPPVAAASYAAAAIAKANPLATGAWAFRMAAGGFITGIAFIYEPALTLDGTLYEIITATMAVSAGIILISMAYVGYSSRPLPMWLRVPLFAIGVACALWHTTPEILRGIVGYSIFIALLLLPMPGTKETRPAIN
ncbi:TRAP transporter permease [Paracoccus sulfuroxidans]|uniref:TRAP transporter 4TM/12TM fusion protein n=1 Tax=Paracoccus sulfuroxidans TaxID=384678 RepID=A0A562NH20_9RHOB|nr:TRAP transporter fused permease subunit [Paracoccus sulfuroxidans]TWI31475.1 TRAP transporter 4TM/12TM fusion protein [Paracoccus sulfuroxidans]